MKYISLMYANESGTPKFTPEEIQAVMNDY